MKSSIRMMSAVVVSMLAGSAYAQESLDEMIERGLSVARSQSVLMAKDLESQPGKLPRTFQDGKLVTSDYQWWCSGFFPGVLWQLYKDNGEEQLRKYAEYYTDRVEPAKTMTSTHDLGFMLNCSFGQGYLITHNQHYLDVICEGTDNLLTRFNDKLGVIQSWGASKKWKYPVIIDNMMNLEMLCFVTRETNNRYYVQVAERHADTTIKNHFREDYSTYHVVSYDPATGEPHAKNTAQGYADNSAWARGQAWGLYGYTMMYRETSQQRYLDQARHIAEYLAGHKNLPEDGIPYWDYDAPNIPDALRDASAGAVMASALIELSQLDPSAEASRWLKLAEKQLRTLSSPAYLVKPGEQCGFILKHSVGSLPGKSEVDVPLTYADYYYVEALLRLKKLRSFSNGTEDRARWVDALDRIATPVLKNLAEGTLKKNMPFESLSTSADRIKVSYLEAVGRTICGIAPFLESGSNEGKEGEVRARLLDWTLRGLRNAVDPKSPDKLLFDYSNDNNIAQPLVDAAFLAEGVLRAPHQIWEGLDKETQQRLIGCWKDSRCIKPYESNWLLFASTVEAALLEFDGKCDEDRLYYGVDKFLDQWYKGDGWYGDGVAFHLDYYNSLVIQPMLTEVLQMIGRRGMKRADQVETQNIRMGRFAEQMERMISPEGSYPVIGRSITYRFGSFHALSDAALLHLLPANVNPAQVRCALTAVILRQLSQANTFDRNGWLRVGYTGAQVHMSEEYINTGSEYLCCAVFCALGLPASDPFWSNPAVEWTSLKAWNNEEGHADHAIRN